mmetsp:Transcript_130380/g.260083  ORF Transcript_130380/g.260083 Transcript_130380/m.260083 type:complete len:829 (-) Transcript_130380:88-2574(-)
MARHNPAEEELVRRTMLHSLGHQSGPGQAAGTPGVLPGTVDPGGWWFGGATPVAPLPLPGDPTGSGAPGGLPNGEDDDLQRALAASAAEAEADAARQETLGGLSEEAALQRALRESAGAAEEAFNVRRLMGPEGPFFPAGLTNSGNSCFWNALLQAIFAATPIFRGALFQLNLGEADADSNQDSNQESVATLGLLRDLFAEMDMGLMGAIDAGDLYRKIFNTAEEADVSEQMHRLFELFTKGPGPLKAVCRELFSGDLYEQLEKGPRRVPLEFCQLDICVTEAAPLEKLLEEHTRDVQGSILRRSYRLPPVLWINLDRFVYDRELQRGRKRQVRLAFPDVLNAWMLVPPEAEWVKKLRTSAERLSELTQELELNAADVARLSADASDAEEDLINLVERQEVLNTELQEVRSSMDRHGAAQELLYQLQAVIVHRGRVETGHYYAYSRSPDSTGTQWVCLNDANVAVCTQEEMRGICEGGEDAKPTSSGPLVHVDAFHQCNAEEEEASTTGSQIEGRIKVGAEETQSHSTTQSLVASINRSDTPTALCDSRPRNTRSGAQQAWWRRASAALGCLPKSGSSMAMAGAALEEEVAMVNPEKYPSASSRAIPGDSRAAPKKVTNVGTGEKAQSASLSNALPSIEPQAPPPQDSTAARCLVYVRRGGDVSSLITEVRQRVPSALQERIHSRNVEFLRKSCEKVAEEFVNCVRHLTAHVSQGREEEGHDAPRDALRAALREAESIRTDGGMGHARIYLLRECWMAFVPWTPEELCPEAVPPDFRNHYGSTAKKMLLDALIKFGQHDVAALIVSRTNGSDAFIPSEMEEWFRERGL